MASKCPASDLPDQPEQLSEARELNRDLKTTVREAMTRAGAIGAQPAGFWRASERMPWTSVCRLPKGVSSAATSMDPSHVHPRVLGLLQHWQSIHPNRGLPGRQHFDPAANATVLPNITLVEVHPGPLRFRYRVLGGRVDTVFGRNLAGHWLDQLYADRIEVLKQYAAVVETKQPVWRRGVPHLAAIANCATIEVLRLPLASDGEFVDKVLSVSLYFDAAGRELEIDPLRRG